MFLFLLAFLALAPAAGERVVEIVVEGNSKSTADEIRASMYTKTGEILDAKTLEKDIVFLWQNKRVLVQDALEEPVPGGIRLRLLVAEVSSIREVSILGNKEMKREDILDAAKITPGVPIDEVVAARARADIVQAYRDKGYFFADVKLTFEREASRAIFEVMEGPLVRIQNISFEGNEALPADYPFWLKKDLVSVMQSGDGWFVFRGTPFQEKTLKEDLIEIRRLYRALGYRDAFVELKDLEFNEERDRVRVRILVYEGPRYFVSSVDIEGNEAIPKEELLPLLHMNPGDPYLAETIRQDEIALARYYGERGYPSHPSVTDHWDFKMPPGEIFDPKETKVKLTYQIHEGSKVKIRDVVIQGNTISQDRVVRRALTVNPGETVNTVELDRSRARLNSLNYFKDDKGYPAVRYHFQDTEKPEEKDLVFQVAEQGETGEFRFGAGVSSVEGVIGQILLRKNNFDLFNPPADWNDFFKEFFGGTAFSGAGQELLLSLSPGTKLSTYNLRFFEPDLFGDHIETTTFEAQFLKRIRGFQEYRETRDAALVNLGKSWTKNFGTRLGLRSELIRISDVAIDAPLLVFESEGKNGLRSTSLDLIYSDLDVPLDPTSGYSLQLSEELAGGPFGADLDFYRTRLYSRLYYPVGVDDRGRPYTLFFKGVLGVAQPFGDFVDVPFPERFFAGGPDSIRGFSFRGIGPTQNGHPTGGEALALAGLELRFPLYSTPFAEGLAETEWIRGVLFLDSGVVGTDIHDDNFREWRASAGFGVRIKLPFLPQAAVVLDYGVPIYKQSSDNTRNFTFSIGTSF